MGGDNLESDVVDSSPEPGDELMATVTVVVPVYNESDYLGRAIPRLVEELEAVPATVSILVVENGSNDDSAAMVRSLMTEFPQLALLQLPEPNYGAAVRAGFAAAETDWVVVFDIDYFSGSFLTAAMGQRDNADLVIGSKRMPGSDDRRSLVRRAATWILNVILRLTLGLKVSDTHGIKAIRCTVLDGVLADVVSIDDLFDTEVVLRAERMGFRIVELPVVVEELRESKSRIWNRVPRTLRGIVRIRRSL